MTRLLKGDAHLDQPGLVPELHACELFPHELHERRDQVGVVVEHEHGLLPDQALENPDPFVLQAAISRTWRISGTRSLAMFLLAM